MHLTTRIVLSIPILLSLAIAGCARMPTHDPLPSGTAITRLTSLDNGSPVAWDNAGTHIALSDGSIKIVSVSTGQNARISSEDAVALAWSPD